MSISQRKLIREKVVAILATPPITGVVGGVFTNRQKRVSREECPVILVYTKSESAVKGIEAPRQMKRTLKLVVEVGVYKEQDAVDDTLDDISEEIEQRLMRNETLDGLASDLLLSDTEIDFITDSESEVGALRVTFDIDYWTDAPIEQLDLDDYERYQAKYIPPNATPDTEPMLDESEVPQV